MVYPTLRTLAVLMLASLQLLAEKPRSPEPVTVTNTASQPVPVVTQGTSAVTGNVVVTNSSGPVSGNVSVTNSSIPVTGSVDVSNLPLDQAGNMRVTEVQQVLKYDFRYVIFQVCEIDPVRRNLCNGTNGEQDASATLKALSSEGWELLNESVISRTPAWANSTPSWQEAIVIFTFRRVTQ